MKYAKYFPLIVILAVLIVSCEKDDSTVIDPILTFPTIDTASITPDVFDTSTVTALATARVSSEEPVSRVTVEVKNPDDNSLITLELKDDGVPPDVSAGDGIYSGTISFSMSCRIVGTYQGIFLAQNISGLYSAQNQVPFSVINSQNVKPVLSNLIAPDSLQKPSCVGSDTMRMAFLQVQVTDPNGLCDVKEAFFNSFKPNGEPSLGNPFTMYDDGNVLPPHCDTIAGDGKYSLCIYIFWNATIGNYTFKFNARDRSVPGLLSDTLFHSIYVYP